MSEYITRNEVLSREAERQRLKDAMERFLQRGGKVTEVPIHVTAWSDLTGDERRQAFKENGSRKDAE